MSVVLEDRYLQHFPLRCLRQPVVPTLPHVQLGPHYQGSRTVVVSCCRLRRRLAVLTLSVVGTLAP